ncbi:MAG: TusE/DsrC/DsvC family sulfur relay protein [Thermoleophilia bacterium]|nr:TusE/DsrC/DsvC family sulfur relay protein [Thermoleophilia bacterium]
MPVIEYQGEQIELDEDGFLVNYKDWNENVARALAEKEGIEELTPQMMDVIRFMRDYYENYRSFPILSSVCRNVHQPGDCVREEFIDPVAAWRIAGLPKPVEEVLAYLAPPRETA